MLARIGIYVVIGAAVLVFLSAIGHCAKVPDNTMCKAELDVKAIAKFQKLLIQCGHERLKIIEATIFATAKGAREKTFIAMLKCVDKECNVYAVAVSYVKDNLKKIDIKPTGERMNFI